MVLVVKNLPANAGDTRDAVPSLGREDPLEEEMATHSSILAWRIPWTKEPSGLQSVWSQRLRCDLKQLSTHTHTQENYRETELEPSPNNA